MLNSQPMKQIFTQPKFHKLYSKQLHIQNQSQTEPEIPIPARNIETQKQPVRQPEEGVIYDQETFPYDYYEWYDNIPQNPLTLKELIGEEYSEEELIGEEYFEEDLNLGYEPPTVDTNEDDGNDTKLEPESLSDL